MRCYPEKDYKEAYEQEHYKSTYLAGRVAELEDKVDDLQFKLDRIKNNPVWKASTPLRKGMHFCIRQVDRVKNCGSIGGVVTKLKYKSNERKAMKHYGTESFPSQEERKKQEETVFPRMVKISILTPLWNTPENFLREMIGSVQRQTYGNWELCLADGSDDAHQLCGGNLPGTGRQRTGGSATESWKKMKESPEIPTSALPWPPVNISVCSIMTICFIPVPSMNM